MKQLFLDGKAGTIQVAEVAEPALRPGALQVRTVFSAISPGTERATVSTARDSYLRTARNRPDLVRRVLDTVKREGVLAAYRKVQSKIGEPKALGYSSAGVVEAIGTGVDDYFRVGDRVACAGQGVASHAEVVSVPMNLAARIPDGVAFESAAFTTLGAIALHGVRQAEPTLGERVAVIGLGIVGLLTVQILKANGARVAAFDLATDLVDRARELGAEVALAGDTDDQVAAAMAWSEGQGVDGAIVTAASSTDAPMVAAAGMCRDRARVVAVGLVPFGLPRDIAYMKELELRISRSYGPGRYDADFEEKGVDYPAAYVRWTETRNLEAFLQLVADGQVRIEPLLTHHYDLSDAPAAYDELGSAKGKRPLGVLIRYPEPVAAAPTETRVEPSAPPTSLGPVSGDIGVAFLGAGSFARSVLLPQFQKAPGVRLATVVTAHGLSATDVQSKFGFDRSGTNMDEALADPKVHLVCIATRHDLHADLVVRSLRAGKHVFVEKPLALGQSELARVEQAAAESPGLVLVGFNRRFSPMAVAIRRAVTDRGPILMSQRVNAGALPPGYWLNDPEAGGGRMIGEGCHFIDLFSFLTGDRPIVDVQAECIALGRDIAEDFAVQVRFEDGSVGQLLYTARGESGLGKERVEAHAGGTSAVLDDYRECVIRKPGGREKVSTGGKGHAQEVAALLEAVRQGAPSPISLPVLAGVTRATFLAHRAAARQG